ncbi:DUF4376 domain-containing protein [Collinsella aerofaciens]|uniref:DUF4376 domain-containing protein n=1 Tax=Collinsella aerofaciens TaxID=74426 RepID=UPI001D005AE3|nr:DUF4376 domain-containing protein [Collinsella aerofaciens]MCB5366910.1 DUF4376 domain-containing protein [Collinsella aerofaciens]MCB5368965.1 DUF4376 domain-containing protein [Collinsella aerofaciens]
MDINSIKGLVPVERKLLTSGFASLDMIEKNQLVSQIAKKEGKMYYEITEDYILEYHKNLKIDVLSQMCNEAIINGFTASNGHTYRTNRDDQINMMGKKIELMEDASITTVAWKTEDVGYIDHTREEWLQVYKESFEHKETNLLKYNTLKQQVRDAQTHEEVLAVSWE